MPKTEYEHQKINGDKKSNPNVSYFIVLTPPLSTSSNYSILIHHFESFVPSINHITVVIFFLFRLFLQINSQNKCLLQE
jgi:hypothetical protein